LDWQVRSSSSLFAVARMDGGTPNFRLRCDHEKT